eukprot:446714-Pyramimonas_sp.AAC.1
MESPTPPSRQARWTALWWASLLWRGCLPTGPPSGQTPVGAARGTQAFGPSASGCCRRLQLMTSSSWRAGSPGARAGAGATSTRACCL